MRSLCHTLMIIGVDGRSKAQASGQLSRKIGDDVTEKVCGDDHVEVLKPPYHVGSHSIDMVIIDLYLGIVLCTDFLDGGTEQLTRQLDDIGLMHDGQLLPTLHGLLESLMGETLCGLSGADIDGHSHIRCRHELAEASVHVTIRQRALAVLAENDHICLAHSALHTRVGTCRTHVGIEIKIMSHGTAGIGLPEMLLRVCRRIMRCEDPAMHGLQSLFCDLRHWVAVLLNAFPTHGEHRELCFYTSLLYGLLHDHLCCLCDLRSDAISVK